MPETIETVHLEDAVPSTFTRRPRPSYTYFWTWVPASVHPDVTDFTGAGMAFGLGSQQRIDHSRSSSPAVAKHLRIWHCGSECQKSLPHKVT